MNPRLFDPAQVHKLECEERLLWLPPGEVLARLEVAQGMTVADIGAGTGYFAIPIARAVAPGGMVFAVDLQPEMLELLRGKLHQPGAPENIELVVGDAARTSLPDASCDLVLMANIWHELEDRPAALREVRRVLKDGGRLAILDWRHDAVRPPGPPLDHRVPVDEAVRTLELHVWTLYHRFPVGRHSYLLLATPTDESVQS